MRHSTLLGHVALLLCACGGQPESAAAPPSAPLAQAKPPAPVPPAQVEPRGPNPCERPAPLTLELEAGVPMTTPFGLELTYAIEDDARRGSGYVFLLRSGARRWETRRTDSNWTAKQTWRGFCWRGGARPGRGASKLEIQIAPVCRDGELVETGGCGDALGS